MTKDEANITIDYLKEMQEGYIEEEGYERHPLPEWYALDKAIETIEQTTWIPVSEGLPKKDGRYYVTRHDDVTQTDFVDILWYEKGMWWNRQATGDYAVIAWMLLPAQHKAESEG